MPSHRSLVSIGMPVYNGERFIRQALDSLLGQTYRHLEVVISDNASTDKTREICLEYAARDPRVRYSRNKVNIGVTPNFRRVFELSSGDYFMWASVDDTKPPTAVESCLEALKKNNRAVMAYGIVLLKVEGRDQPVVIANAMAVSGPDIRERIHGLTQGIRSQCVVYGLYRRGALARTTYSNFYGQEYLLCLQMCLLGPLQYVRTPMITYRQRKAVVSFDPMYKEVPLTLMNLLKVGGMIRRKCWTVLLGGCYYLMTVRGIRFTRRVVAISAHLSAFSSLYRRRLMKEIVFQSFEPVSWLVWFFWLGAKRSSISWCVARKFHAFLS